MAKYSKELVNKVVALIEEDAYTITEICSILNIGRKTFYEWKSTKPEFAQALCEAMEQREELLRMKARQAMRRKLEGYKQVETKTTYVIDKNGDPSQLIVKEHVVKEKYCAPNTSTIALALNDGKQNRKDVQPEHTASATSFPPFVIQVPSDEIKHQLDLLQSRVINVEQGGGIETQ